MSRRNGCVRLVSRTHSLAAFRRQMRQAGGDARMDGRPRQPRSAAHEPPKRGAPAARGGGSFLAYLLTYYRPPSRTELAKH